MLLHVEFVPPRGGGRKTGSAWEKIGVKGPVERFGASSFQKGANEFQTSTYFWCTGDKSLVPRGERLESICRTELERSSWVEIGDTLTGHPGDDEQ